MPQNEIVNLDELRRQREEQKRAGAMALKSGGGGGTYDGMEARVKALEDKFEKVDSKLDTILKELGELKVSVARLTGRVDSMPGSLQLLGFAIAVFVAAGLLKYIAP